MDELQLSIAEKVDNLPQLPGVYLYKDAKGQLLYVGKAKRLRNRVKSYFQKSRPVDGRIRVMISKIHDVEFIVTDSEAEALMLENNLIKERQPRYNVMLRDDKSYPYICVTNEDKPRVYSTRVIIKNGSKYYGPYANVGMMKMMMETIRSAFGLCTCACSSKSIDATRGLPKWHNCFNEYVDKCSGDWPQESYKDAIAKVIRLLNGKTAGLLKELQEEMFIASDALRFEQAAKIRDGMAALSRYSEKMKIVSPDLIDRDIFSLYVDGEDATACGVMFKVRDGKLLGRHHKILKNIEGVSEGDMLQGFMEDYYTSEVGSYIPDEVIASVELGDDEVLGHYLNEAAGKKVPLIVPKIGEKSQLIKMATANAKLILGEFQLEKMKQAHDAIPHAVKALQRDLSLKRLPRRIECFDNSNLQGTDPVASMVCFVDAQPRKSEYKRFSIKTVEGANDFASMKEILIRRYSRVMQEKLHIPDLIVVDGGKGQLSSAVEALKEIGFYGQCEIIGLAKRLEEVFFPGHSDSVIIPKTSSGLKLLQRVRDEAHRFAITYHREKREKRTLHTKLTDIPGIGEKTATKLLKEIGSLKKIKEASREDLEAVAGKKVAQALHEYFHPNEGELGL